MIARTNIYADVTNQIIAQLEAGVAPWRKPWASCGGGMPKNVAGRPYRGVNIILLWSSAQAQGFGSSMWATFNQWRKLGGHVEKGQKGTKIVFWSVIDKTEVDQNTGDETEDRRFFARQYTVFNLDQCGGEKLNRFRKPTIVRDFADFHPAEEAIRATGADIRHGGDGAYYRPSHDYIQLPIKSSFASEAAYYSTALHELVHWSGHASRLARLHKFSRFGDQSYAAEELVAELGASFLTAALGVPNCGIQDNAAYLKNWLGVLKADSRAIFTASTAATKAAADEQAVQDGCYFDLKAAQRVSTFFERFLRHSKGQFANQPFTLLDGQWRDVIAPLSHAGHPVLRWMAGNVSVETDAADNWKPSKKKSVERIDGIVALIMALNRAGRHEKWTSIYNQRGMLFLTGEE